ncbi:uncharacterized protein BO72DRAFT_451055 [Aspergillus fijiensis CBS 313.89]|uniref:Uncharacterized protein n=1 Tax=Aspergillus fijiensis CBS 313.89 TaxID=1448319 RepID=A0A8G1VVH8_9EURO|nr:uncharacterized protein BO72DRAFT_451055 [Aspergillus fijiensis CBS 313.89]RAK74147.1 hypothetical protein BO72DRAFT_451055 [Aspergillus fijiensis CBS 313.89]
MVWARAILPVRAVCQTASHGLADPKSGLCKPTPQKSTTNPPFGFFRLRSSPPANPPNLPRKGLHDLVDVTT